jgi:hypothetical protein
MSDAADGALEPEKSGRIARDPDARLRYIRTIIATLQDLGYNLDKVDAGSGTISATKLAALKMTASVYPRNPTQLMVRANAIVKAANVRDTQVDDPAFYQQDFFEPLSKAIFLQALQVDDAAAAQTDPKVPSDSADAGAPAKQN